MLLTSLAKILSYLTGVNRDREVVRVGNQAFCFIEFHWDDFKEYLDTLYVDVLPDKSMHIYIKNVRYFVSSSGKINLGPRRAKKVNSRAVIDQFEETHLSEPNIVIPTYHFYPPVKEPGTYHQDPLIKAPSLLDLTKIRNLLN